MELYLIYICEMFYNIDRLMNRTIKEYKWKIVGKLMEIYLIDYQSVT